MNAPTKVNSGNLLKRARDVNYEYDPNSTITKRHLSTYNPNILRTYLRTNFFNIERDILADLENSDINKAVLTLDRYLVEGHKVAKIKPRIDTDDRSNTLMERANKVFYDYSKCSTRMSSEDITIAWTRYSPFRK